MPAWEGNYNAVSNTQDYKKSPEIEELYLISSLNQKSRQACNVRVEIPPTEAAAFFDQDYTLTLGGRLYDNRLSTDYHELPEQSYTFHVPAADFTFEPYEEIVMDTQIVAEKEFGVDALDYLDVDTEAIQYFYAGFETNPYEDTVNDFLGFQFELEGGNEMFKYGSVIYQWATYVKSDDFSSDPYTVGCSTTVGDPYTAEAQTFKGTSSMSVDSTNVANRTVTQQNSEEKAPLKDSFGTTQDLEWYNFYNATDSVTVQPCRAVIEYDGKLNDTNPIFGVYNVTLGSRIYANVSDTEPKALPDQSFQIEFTMPATDFAELYEETEVEEDKYAYVPYLEDKFRRKIVTTWDSWSGEEKFYWLRVEGGYKLYDDADKEDRWYFKLGIERPTSMFTDGEIQYFWLTYEDEDMQDDYTGAVGCKITTGSPQKTKVDQWRGAQDITQSSTEIQGKTWKNQNKEGKMVEPEYFATYWNEDNYIV